MVGIFRTIRFPRQLAVGICAAVLLIAIAVSSGSRAVAVSKCGDPYPDLYAHTDGDFIATTEKTAYLTFDDGPSKNTEKILDLLNQYQIKATFFVIGQTGDYYEGLLKRMAEEGHTIGVHSYSHEYKEIYSSVDHYLADFSKIHDLICRTTGVCPTIFRFPGGSTNSTVKDKRVMKEIIAEMGRRGFIYYDWNSVAGDHTAEKLDKTIIANNILDSAKGKKNVMILCHDNATRTTTVEALPKVIETMKKEGYTFAPLTDQVKPIQFAAAKK